MFFSLVSVIEFCGFVFAPTLFSHCVLNAGAWICTIILSETLSEMSANVLELFCQSLGIVALYFFVIFFCNYVKKKKRFSCLIAKCLLGHQIQRMNFS